MAKSKYYCAVCRKEVIGSYVSLRDGNKRDFYHYKCYEKKKKLDEMRRVKSEQ